MAKRNLFSLALIVFYITFASAARADIAIHADGHRSVVEEPKRDANGRWMGTIDGRRQVLKPGEIVVLIDDAGQETELLLELSDAKLSPPATAALASLADPKNEAWFASLEHLALPPTQAAFEAITELSKSNHSALRSRAVTAMAALRTKASAVAATQIVLREKDAKARREQAVALFTIREIMRRSDTQVLVLQGLEDTDVLVRIEFALVAEQKEERAKAVLRKDGLKHGDHHVRESAAVDLGLRNDPAGMSVLQSMLARKKMPGMDSDPETGERLLIAEQVQICQILGALGGATALEALKKAKNSKHEAVRKAAELALAVKG